VIAGHGWYDTRPGQLPWQPIAMAGSLGMLLALSRIPVVARVLAAPRMARRLVLPHSFRVTGVFFLLYLALGHLPALFALPAGMTLGALIGYGLLHVTPSTAPISELPLALVITADVPCSPCTSRAWSRSPGHPAR
jgi:hypothetical protein